MLKYAKLICLISIIIQQSFSFAQENVSSVDSIQARDLNRKAIALYRDGFHTQALDTFLYCLEFRKKLYGEEDYNLAAVYSGIGISYWALGQFELALKYFNLAEQNYALRENRINDPRKNLYINIGNVYRDKMDFNQALRYFEQALALYKNENKPDRSLIAGVNYNIAEIYYVTNNYKKSKELIDANLRFAFDEDKILFYELLAFINQVQGKISDARKNYLEVIKLTKILNSENHINVATAFLNYAFFLISNNRFQEADENLYAAHQIIQFSKLTNGNTLSYYYKLQGYLSSSKSIETKNIESFKKQKIQNIYVAIEWYKKGLVALNFPENFDLSSIQKSENWVSPMNCIVLLKFIADDYLDISSLEQPSGSPVFSESLENAIKTYQVVASLIQKARKELSTDESKIQLTTLEYSIFYKLIQTSFTAYSITNDLKYLNLAFQNAERVKSSSVFENLSNQIAVENSLIPDSLIALEQKLNSTISIYTEKLFEEKNNPNPDSAQINDFSEKIFNTSREREKLHQYMENEFEDYYDLKFSNSILSAEEIQNKLKENQVILEYVLNETDTVNELYTFIISAKSIDLSKQVVSKEFLTSIETMFEFMSNENFQFSKNDDSKRFCTSSFHLYEKLIFPFINEIQNKDLIIIPDGKLCYIPFDGLLQTIPDPGDIIKFNRLDYLIQDFNITYSNSANLLFKKNPSSKKLKNKTLAFAPEYFGDSVDIGGKYLKLIPLPGVQKEVENISNILNTEVFKGNNATENNFRNNVENFDILHLAMHAFINDSLPALSSLAFTQLPEKETNLDGIFKTSDIYNLRLKAKLTVLSACNTGIGQLKKGEGIMSLARGFIYAGCPSTIVSLWEIDDQSGTQIMSSFYKNLKKGKSKGESLRAAKLEYLNSSNSRNAHPHYWLSFVSIGDNSPLFVSYDLYFFVLLILALVGIGADQFWRTKKARKKRAK